jgi:hypothetical protein
MQPWVPGRNVSRLRIDPLEGLRGGGDLQAGVVRPGIQEYAGFVNP